MKIKISISFVTILVILLIISPLMGISEYAKAKDDGFDIRNDYKAELVFGDFNLASGRILRTFSITFDKNYFDELENGQELLKGLSIILKMMGFDTEIDKSGKVIGKIQYDSMTDYYIKSERDGYEKDEPSDYKEERTFLFRNIYSEQKTFFAQLKENDHLLIQPELYDLSEEELALGYHFGTPYKIINSDAEKKYFDTSARIYVHEFQMDMSTINREITVTQKVPNAINWYLLAIIVTIPVIIVQFLINYFLNSKRHKKEIVNE